MKRIALLVSLLTQITTLGFASSKAPAKGMVLCSADFPAQVGFSLVRFKDVARLYSGQFHLTEDVRLQASFYPKTHQLKLRLERIIDDFDNTEMLMQSSFELDPGETWRLELPIEDRVVVMTCRTHWDLRSQ